jgi:hypothetical protein
MREWGSPLEWSSSRLIWPAGEGFHSRSVDPHWGQLQIRKVSFRDYRKDPAILRPTGGAAPWSRGETCATSPAGLPEFGWGRPRSSKVVGIVDKVSGHICKSAGLLAGSTCQGPLGPWSVGTHGYPCLSTLNFKTDMYKWTCYTKAVSTNG